MVFSVTEHCHILASDFLCSIAQPHWISILDSAFIALVLCWIGSFPNVVSQLSGAELVLAMASVILTDGSY